MEEDKKMEELDAIVGAMAILDKTESPEESETASFHAAVESAYAQGLSPKDVHRHIIEHIELSEIKDKIYQKAYLAAEDAGLNYDYFWF